MIKTRWHALFYLVCLIVIARWLWVAFTHPELTQTQLAIGYWVEYAAGILVMIAAYKALVE